MNRTKVIAYADNLIIVTRGKTVREAENIANIEMSKISAWAKANKIRFNRQKSKAMLLSRRKCKERNELEIYLNNQPLMQVLSLKYLGLIFDPKLTFRDHIIYMTEKCSKLIFALSKSANLNWGLNHAALKTIYIGGILPHLLYGAPVWINTINKANYKLKLTRVQRLINTRIAKAYRTVSNEALCIITGLTPYRHQNRGSSPPIPTNRGSRKEEAMIDDTGVKHWLHPAVTMTILKNSNEDNSTIQIFTNVSKSEQGVGAGIAVYRSGTHTKSLKYRCTNN